MAGRYRYVCLACGGSFDTDRRRIRFCSERCALRAALRALQVEALEAACNQLFWGGGVDADTAIRNVRKALYALGYQHAPLPGLLGDPYDFEHHEHHGPAIP